MTASKGAWGRSLEPETRLLRRLQTAMSEAEQMVARRLKMGSSDLAAMSRITFARDAVGPKWLATQLGMTPGSVTELVDRLERAGHLERIRDTTDRRRVQLRPTGSAVAEVGATLQPLLLTMDAMARDFDDDERAVITRFLTASVEAYENFAHPAPDEAEPPL